MSRSPFPRGLRARLTATYTLAAALVIVAGAAVFLFVLTAGLRANLDSDLASRADTLAAVLRDANASTDIDVPLVRERPLHSGLPDAIDAYRLPSGRLVSANGIALPPITLPPELGNPEVRGSSRGSVNVGKSEYRLAVVQVQRRDGTWLAVAGASRATNDEAVDEVARGMLFAGPLLILVVAVGTWLLGGAALRPVDRMRRDAAALSAQPGASRLRVPDTGDELAALATTLNELLERLQRSLGRQRALVSDAGHELRTPLAVLRTELELADRPGRSREELAEAVSYAAVEADRLSQLADDLLFLARADEGEPLVRPQPTDVAALLSSAVRTFRTRADAAGVALDLDVPETLPGPADAAALRRAVDNILSNALEHTRSGGRIGIEAAAERDHLVVRVSDTGTGFPEEFLPHAFERFRRADAARRHGTGHAGTGLGLAIVAEVAAAHGGRARARNRDGGGACVELELPLPHGAASSARDGAPV
ncbi:MAG: two-component system, OmpR family, sensor kinase [Frankiaceae bacterium]|nr:two-component system, OmpR family, sensor kinase [Frankiaceae bacterium]